MAHPGRSRGMTQRTPRIRILLWTRRSREILRDKLAELLADLPAGLLETLGVVLDELAKNAIKANHKHLLIRHRIVEGLRRDAGLNLEEAQLRAAEICEDTVNYNEFLDEHPAISAGLTGELAGILRQESAWIDLRNKKHGGQAVTEGDNERLSGTGEFRAIYREAQGRRVYVEFRASRTNDQLWIEIVNAAPIVRRDLERIEEKRQAFKVHRDAGTEYEFFMNSMDNSDGGSGFGYATIDSHLANLGVEPLDALRIISLHSTNVMLHLNLSDLPKEA